MSAYKLKHFKSLDDFIKYCSKGKLGFGDYVYGVKKTCITYAGQQRFRKAQKILSMIEFENNVQNFNKHIDENTLMEMFDRGIDWELGNENLWSKINNEWGHMISHRLVTGKHLDFPFMPKRKKIKKLNKKAIVALGGLKKGKLNDI